MRGLGLPALIPAEEFLGGGSRGGPCGSALPTPFCSVQPRALAADIAGPRLAQCLLPSPPGRFMS